MAQTRRPEDQRRGLGALMGKVRLAINREVTAGLIARGHRTIRPSAAQVFRGLDRGGTRLTELARRAEITKQSMGSLVAELEADGYLERVPDPADGRAKLVRLTRQGQGVARDITDLGGQVESRLLEGLGARRMQAVRTGLERMLEELGETYRTDWFARGRGE